MSEQKYYGIADAKGVESFIPYKNLAKDNFPYVMRANSNRHRHAVYYLVTIDTVDANIVNALIDSGKYQKALKMVKKRAITIGFPEEHSKQYKNSWDLIPTPKLDPY